MKKRRSPEWHTLRSFDGLHTDVTLQPRPIRPSNLITYSPAYTLVPTYECFNRCTYCNFRVDPGQHQWLTRAEAEALLKPLPDQGVIEVLILSGEVHPLSPRRLAWFQHLYDLCELALGFGLLPHTNAGPLSWDELLRLKTVNVSMGLMLEQLTPSLQQTVHRHAPSKDPNLRLQQLAWAGKLQIPFTTGLLLGLGETESDRWQTLEAIAHLHEEWGHIQEVILQPHSPGVRQARNGTPFNPKDLVTVVARARQILPAEVTIQIPPNLIADPNILKACLAAGARDLGGIGPRDEVNPDYPHPQVQALEAALSQTEWYLTPRLPIYPQYDQSLSPQLRALVKHHRQQLDLLIR